MRMYMIDGEVFTHNSEVEIMPMTLRERTDAALKRKAEKKQKQIDAQIIDFFATMEPIADTGVSKGEYLKDLSKEAREVIESQGIKLEDNGGGVASSWVAKW